MANRIPRVPARQPAPQGRAPRVEEGSTGPARPAAARGAPPKGGVGKGRHPLARAACDAETLRAVARSEDIGKARFAAFIYGDAAAHFPARLFDKLRVRPHADGDDEEIELYRLPALQVSGISFKAKDAVRKEEHRAACFERALHHLCARLVEDGGQNAVRKIDEAGALDARRDAFEAFEPDEPRAYDEHLFFG